MEDLGTVVVSWVALSAVVGFIAGARQRGFLGFFLLSLLLSPLIGLIVVLATPGPGQAAEASQRRAPCWQCKELVVEGAPKCRFCGADLVWNQPSV